MYPQRRVFEMEEDFFRDSQGIDVSKMSWYALDHPNPKQWSSDSQDPQQDALASLSTI